MRFMDRRDRTSQFLDLSSPGRSGGRETRRGVFQSDIRKRLERLCHVSRTPSDHRGFRPRIGAVGDQIDTNPTVPGLDRTEDFQGEEWRNPGHTDRRVQRRESTGDRVASTTGVGVNEHVKKQLYSQSYTTGPTRV